MITFQKLLAIAGHGSGLDADKLDGQEGAFYATSTHHHNTTYLGINAKAADSDKLDNHDSTYFATATHNHDDAYLGKTDKAADSDKLNGLTAGSYALSAKNITAGDGLTGGGTLEADRTITLGTPSTITASTTNSVTENSHSHALTLPFDIVTGSITLSDSWATFSFGKTFAAAPKVVITPNSATSGVIAPKVRNISTTQFDACIGGSGFSNIVCSYIAI